MPLVDTTAGRVASEDLDITEVVTWSDNGREVAVEWRLAGELVRRDVWVDVLRFTDSVTELGAI